MEKEVKTEILSIIDDRLIKSVSVILTRLIPVVKRISLAIDNAERNFRVLKKNINDMEALKIIGEEMEDIALLSSLLDQYLNDAIDRFRITIRTLSDVIEDAAKNKELNKVALGLHAQKILMPEAEYLRAVRENAKTLKNYGNKYGIKGINYKEEIKEAAKKDQIISRLEAIKAAITSILIDRKRSTVRSLEEIKKQLENFHGVEELSRN